MLLNLTRHPLAFALITCLALLSANSVLPLLQSIHLRSSAGTAIVQMLAALAVVGLLLRLRHSHLPDAPDHPSHPPSSIDNFPLLYGTPSRQ